MKSLRKRIVALLLVLTIILPLMPVLAEGEVTGPQISSWALEDLTDSQYIGILEITEENLSRDYTKLVEAEELKALNDSFKNKFESNNVKKVENFDPVDVREDLTRGRVLEEIFNVLGQYDPKVTADIDPIKYLSEKKIVRGKGSDLNLEDEVTVEEVLVFYVRAIRDFYKENDLGGKGVFYKIENKGNTVYLFGSIHIGDNKMYPLKFDRLKAFEEADNLFVEINTQDPELVEAMAMIQYRTDGKKLKDELGEEIYAEYQAIANSLGLEEAVYENLEAWAVLNQLSLIPVMIKNPISSMIGIDTFFITKANLQGKSIESLETLETQKATLEKFYGADKEVLLEKIREAIEVIKSEEKLNESLVDLEKLINYWNEGDEKNLALGFDEDENARILTKDRDPEMVKQIIGLLESEKGETSFVVVGAGHYAPKGSVVDILKNAGYKVDNITN